MQQIHQNPLLTLLSQITQALSNLPISPSSPLSPSSTNLPLLLTTLKSLILSNPNNYHHPYYTRLTFVEIYQFVIQCLSYQCGGGGDGGDSGDGGGQGGDVGKLLWYVLAVMVRFWVQGIQEVKGLYQGILALFQQRTYCGQNCFKFFKTLVQTMQSPNPNLHPNPPTHPSPHSTIPSTRSNIQTYFIYHILNQMLAFSNIFLDRCVVRNNSGNDTSRDNSEVRGSRGRSGVGEDSGSLGSRGRWERNSGRRGLGMGVGLGEDGDQVSSSERQHQQESELYTLTQPQPIILSILSLIRACLSYDFSQTSRYHQQSQFEPTKSPIILPTKYSKYCRFSEYDIFLKNDNTTQMLNYLYLITPNIALKLQILQILKSMTRIHFRYFKNKTLHKLHLEDLGYVVCNLLTGLDLQEVGSGSLRKGCGYGGKGTGSGKVGGKGKGRGSKVSVAVLLGEIVGILLYHQPTFYLVEGMLVEWLIQKVCQFVVGEILGGECFQQYVQTYLHKNSSNPNPNQISITRQDLSLLLQTYLAQLPKLSDYCKIYLRSNEHILQKINQIYIKIGEKYYWMLCYSINEGGKDGKRIGTGTGTWDEIEIEMEGKFVDSDRKANMDVCGSGSLGMSVSKKVGSFGGCQIYDGSILETAVIEESSKKNISNPSQSPKILNPDPNSNPIPTPNSPTQIPIQPQTASPPPLHPNTSPNPNLNNNTNTNPTNRTFEKIREKCDRICYILDLVRDTGSIHCLRNLLNIFRVYCPHHQHITTLSNSHPNTQLNQVSSNLSYTDTNPKNPLQPPTSIPLQLQPQPQPPSSPPPLPLVPQPTTSQKWMTSWLCNFQNHFHVTAGHCRQPQKWQIELHHQLMVQLLEDYCDGVKMYRGGIVAVGKIEGIEKKNWLQQVQNNEVLNQCLMVMTLYVCDKIIYDCRLPIQAYVEYIRLDLLTILQWLCSNLTHNPSTPKNSHLPHLTHLTSTFNNNIELQPILHLLTNIDYYTYFNNYHGKIRMSQGGNRRSSFRNSRSREEEMGMGKGKEGEWVEEVFGRCLGNLGRFVEGVGGRRDDIGDIYGKVLYLLLKIYTQANQIKFQHNHPTNLSPQFLPPLTTLLQTCPQTLHFLLQQLNTQSFPYQKYKKQLQQIYQKIIKNGCIDGKREIEREREAGQHGDGKGDGKGNGKGNGDGGWREYGYFYRFVEENWEGEGKGEGGEDLGIVVRCLGVVCQLERKVGGTNWNQISNVIALYLKVITKQLQTKQQNLSPNCNCTQLIPPILKLLNSPMHSHLLLNPQPIHSLLLQIQSHTACLQTLQLPHISSLLTNYLNLTNIFNTPKSIYEQVMKMTMCIDGEGEGGELIFVGGCCGWMMDLVGRVRDVYQCGEVGVVRMEEEILEIVAVGYGGVRSQSRCFGVLSNIQQLLRVQPNQDSHMSTQIHQILTTNLTHLLTKTLTFLLSKTTQTYYQIPTTFPSFPTFPTFPPQSPQLPQPLPYLKVDNMITVFTLYHHFLELLWRKHEDLVRGVVKEEVLVRCVGWLGDKGVGWVVRKLELWDVGEEVYGKQKLQQNKHISNTQDQSLNHNHNYSYDYNSNYNYNQHQHQIPLPPITPQKPTTSQSQSQSQNQQHHSSQKQASNTDIEQSPHKITKNQIRVEDSYQNYQSQYHQNVKKQPSQQSTQKTLPTDPHQDNINDPYLNDNVDTEQQLQTKEEHQDTI